VNALPTSFDPLEATFERALTSTREREVPWHAFEETWP